LQDLSFEALQGALQAFALVQMNFSQRDSPRFASRGSRLQGTNFPLGLSCKNGHPRMDIGKMLDIGKMANPRRRPSGFSAASIRTHRLLAKRQKQRELIGSGTGYTLVNAGNRLTLLHVTERASGMAVLVGF
jgi:hypothetical protein